MSLKQTITALRPKLAEAAQAVYDAWEQVDGEDEHYGAGGICEDVAGAMAGVLAEKGIDLLDGGQDGDDHAYLIAYDDTDACIVDIPPSVYETGAGYKWTKRPGVTIEPTDVVVESIERSHVVDEDSEGKYASVMTPAQRLRLLADGIKRTPSVKGVEPEFTKGKSRDKGMIWRDRANRPSARKIMHDPEMTRTLHAFQSVQWCVEARIRGNPPVLSLAYEIPVLLSTDNEGVQGQRFDQHMQRVYRTLDAIHPALTEWVEQTRKSLEDAVGAAVTAGHPQTTAKTRFRGVRRVMLDFTSVGVNNGDDVQALVFLPFLFQVSLWRGIAREGDYQERLHEFLQDEVLPVVTAANKDLIGVVFEDEELFHGRLEEIEDLRHEYMLADHQSSLDNELIEPDSKAPVREPAAPAGTLRLLHELQHTLMTELRDLDPDLMMVIDANGMKADDILGMTFKANIEGRGEPGYTQQTYERFYKSLARRLQSTLKRMQDRPYRDSWTGRMRTHEGPIAFLNTTTGSFSGTAPRDVKLQFRCSNSALASWLKYLNRPSVVKKLVRDIHNAWEEARPAEDTAPSSGS